MNKEISNKRRQVMKINGLELCNYKGFEKIRFNFHDKLNLFVGVNGSGKSSVLDAMATALSWLINRIQRENSNGTFIAEGDLKNGTDNGFIEICAIHDAEECWRLTKSARGTKSLPASYSGVSSMAECIRDYYHNTLRLPVIAYYPVGRVVNRITPDIDSRESISDLDVYENALSGKENFRAFFNWFYHQDNVLNEKALSRSKWMVQHKQWVKQKVDKILSSFEKLLPDHDGYTKEELRHLSKMIKNEFIIEDPRMLFMELSHLLHRFEGKHVMKYDMVMHDIEYMFHKMASLSRDFRDDLIENNEYFLHIVQKIVRHFRVSPEYKSSDDAQKESLQFTWQTFSFAILISLWWMSDKGRANVEKLLGKTLSSIQRDQFFEIEDDFTKQLSGIVQEDISSKQQIQRNEGKELHFVRRAIENFVPEYQNLQIKRVPRPRMELSKNGKVFDLNQLSDGEKNLIALIGDIARRLTMANPDMNNPLEGVGIILIDEIDLHLHPKWQRIVAHKMPELFPNCQFFISTHSPQIISHVKPESIFVLENKNGAIIQSQISSSYGKNTDRILEDIMDVTARPHNIDDNIKSIFKMIQNDNIDGAQEKIKELQSQIGDDGDLIRANVLIKRREIIGK